MQYLLDTVTLVRHFTGKGKIGLKASYVLKEVKQGDGTLVISIISLMEIMYLAEKNRIEINLIETLERIEASSKYIIVELCPDILRVAQGIAFYELHDRLILATAKWLGIKIISSDSAFNKIKGIDLIWE